MDKGNLRITPVGGPTAVLETSGLRLLTDPTFDPAGCEYVSGPDTLRKTSGPALSPEATEPIDAVLLSHDQHFDNLDHAGRATLTRVGKVFTTPSGSERLGDRAIGLKPWQSSTLVAPDERILRVTATPARHGPPGIEPMSGEVIGFLLTFDDRTDRAVCFSGDTVWFEGGRGGCQKV